MSKEKIKVPWWVCIIAFTTGVIAALIWLLWHKLYPKEAILDLQTLGVWFGGLGTFVAVIFVVRNTNKQMGNQNKQMHRPYIIVNIPKRFDISEGIKYVKQIHKIDLKGENEFPVRNVVLSRNYAMKLRISKDISENNEIEFTGLSLKLINKGNGIATNIWGYDLYSKEVINTYWDFEYQDKESDKFLDVAMCFQGIDKNESTNADMILAYNVKKQEHDKKPDKDEIDVIIVYTDILENIYMTLFSIEFKYFFNSSKKSYDYKEAFFVYSSESKAFKDYLSVHNVSEKEIVDTIKHGFLNIS